MWTAALISLAAFSMLKPALSSIQPAVKNITKDKINLLMAIIPVLIGIALYYFLGSWIYENAMREGREIIETYVSQDTWGTIVYYLAAAILTVMLFFMVNFTFVLAVTLIASPFNDVLSARIEKNMKGEANLELGKTFQRLIFRLFYTLLNEVKKVGLIVFLSLLAFSFGYIPLLTPVSVFIAVVLLAVEFIDYSWSRHDLSFKECLRDLRKNLAGYSFGGAFFFIIVSVPLVNLVVPPLATSYFTTLWMKNHESGR